MNDPRIEEMTAEFLELREREPHHSAESFADRHPAIRTELLASIHFALVASELLPFAETVSALPATIGPYRVIRILGRGGMGVVYEVERNDARFALKRIPLAPLLGPRVLERFRRESEILGKLSHPNIVKVYDSGIEDEAPYLVMELVDGENLAEASAKLPLSERLALIKTLCRAVHAAHEAGIIHRDLKPQNVLLRGNGTPVLLDFGLGCAEDFPTLTATGDLLGTPRYMAHEQLHANQTDRRTDVHALGLILYEIATGRPAYTEDSRERTLEAVREGRFSYPRQVTLGFPRALEKIILTALAFDPEHRFQTAEALAEDLERFLSGKPVRARPPGSWIRFRQSIRRKPARAAVGFLTLALLSAGAWFLSQPKVIDIENARLAKAEFARGVGFWLDEKDNAASNALRESLAKDPRSFPARALLSHLGGLTLGESERAQPLFQALEEHKAGKNAEALVTLDAVSQSSERDALTSCVIGLCAFAEKKWELAEKEFAAAALDVVASRRLAENLGTIRLNLGKLEDAERDFRRALEIGPESPEIWTKLAEVYGTQKNLQRAIEAAEVSLKLSGEKVGKTVRLLASLLNQNGARAKAQEILRRILVLDPRDAEAQFLLAYSLDADHNVIECERAYLRALELRPKHATAMQCLANLYAGADRGHCKGCDQAYTEHPEMLRPEEATRLLLKAIRTDGGRNKALVENCLALATKIPDRAPLIALLREMTAGKEKTPAVLNLEWVLRRMELNEGSGREK